MRKNYGLWSHSGAMIGIFTILLMNLQMVGSISEAKTQTQEPTNWSIGPNDSVFTISEALYHTPTLWKAIWELNQDKFQSPTCSRRKGVKAELTSFNPLKEECDGLPIINFRTDIEPEEMELKLPENKYFRTEALASVRQRHLPDTRPEFQSVLNTDFKVGQTFLVKATAYNSLREQTDATPFIAAMGQRVYPGLVASNCLPLGTVIKIKNIVSSAAPLPSEFTLSREYDVGDCMNQKYHCTGWYDMYAHNVMSNGIRYDFWIDFWFRNHKQALDFGAKYMEIEITKVGDYALCRKGFRPENE